MCYFDSSKFMYTTFHVTSIIKFMNDTSPKQLCIKREFIVTVFTLPSSEDSVVIFTSSLSGSSMYTLMHKCLPIITHSVKSNC